MIKLFAGACLASLAFAASGVYDYNEFGDDWGDSFPLCKNGREQSPIDLNGPGLRANDLISIAGFEYQNYDSVKVTRKQHTIISDFTDGELDLTFGDGSSDTFVPLQFHFHAPSEHTVDGKSYDLEVHFVHKYKDTGDLGAVIGVFFDTSVGGDTDNFFIE